MDLNRNFDVAWGTVGASPYPSSESYRGPSVASEPETSALQAYVAAIPNLVAGIDLHSYGQLILRPFGYKQQDHPNEQQNRALGDGMRDTILNFSGTKYASLKSVGLYPASGAFDDWLTSQGTIGLTMEVCQLYHLKCL